MRPILFTIAFLLIITLPETQVDFRPKKQSEINFI